MVAVLHSLSSQKHIFPLPPPSDIQTWSTMNMLMSRFSVQLRRTFQSAKRNDENIRFLRINLANKCQKLGNKGQDYVIVRDHPYSTYGSMGGGGVGQISTK